MSLLLWYKFNGADLGEDSSGSSLGMTNVGATSFSDSEVGDVVFLNGSSYMSLSSSLVPSAMLGASSRTISFWAKTGSTTGGAIHCNGSNFAHRRFRGRHGGGTRYGIDLHTNTSFGSIEVPLNTWGHFACTFDSGTTVLNSYVDGVLDASTVQTRVDTGSGTFSIGRDSTNPSYAYFNGYVSDFRVYDHVLDAAAVNALTNAGPLGAGSLAETGEEIDISTDYVYTENGVTQAGVDAASGGNYTFYGWEGPTSWTITFPAAIENVMEIDFTVMEGVTLGNGTLNYDGALQIKAYDEADNLVGSRASSIVYRQTSNIPVSAIGVLSLDMATVKKVQILGPSNSGPNISMAGVVEGVTTYRIVTRGTASTLSVQMYKSAADLTWDSVPGASTYTLTQTLVTNGLESVAADETEQLSFTTRRLLPGSSYQFKLYTDLDLMNPVGTISGTTLAADVSLNDVFETGDSIKLNIPGFRSMGGAKFVRRGGRVEYTPGVPLAFAFDPDSGPGQSATLGLTGDTDVTVSFDEGTSEVSVDGVTCAVGGYVVVDGKKMSVVDI